MERPGYCCRIRRVVVVLGTKVVFLLLMVQTEKGEDGGGSKNLYQLTRQYDWNTKLYCKELQVKERTN